MALEQASRSHVSARLKVCRLEIKLRAPSSLKVGSRQRRATAIAEEAITLGLT